MMRIVRGIRWGRGGVWLFEQVSHYISVSCSQTPSPTDGKCPERRISLYPHANSGVLSALWGGGG